MKLSRKAALLGCCLSFFAVGGVYATWQYSVGFASDGETLLSMSLNTFIWEGVEELPEDETTGHDHISLLNDLVNGEGIGLNSPESYLNSQISYRDTYWNRDTLGSMAITQGDELEELFSAKTMNISFIVQFIDDNGDGNPDYYYIFTTDVDLGEKRKPNIAIGKNVYPVYRTLVENVNGTWTIIKTQTGYAPSAYYEESNIFINWSRIPAFNTDKWVEGSP